MAGYALGLIEAVGLAAAVEAVDAALKSANVELIGYELTNGGGLVTIKLQGEVGAVTAAIQAGCAAAEKVNKVYSRLVIPRPHESLDTMTASSQTVGCKKKELNADVEKAAQAPSSQSEGEKEESGDGLYPVKSEFGLPSVLGKVTENEEPEIKDEGMLQKSGTAASGEVLETEDPLNATVLESKKKECCNLCNDSKCTRKKGEPKTLCIHFKELK